MAETQRVKRNGMSKAEGIPFEGGETKQERWRRELDEASEAPKSQGGKRSRVEDVPALRTGLIDMVIIGRDRSPLVQHRMSDDARADMEGKRTGAPTKPRGPKDPISDFLSSPHVIGSRGKLRAEKKNGGVYAVGARFGFPASAIKHAMMAVAVDVGLKGAVIKRNVFVVGCADDPNLMEILTPQPPRMRRDDVRIGNFGNKKPDVRYRAEFSDWSAKFSIEYNENIITPAQIAQLLEQAGFSVGLGEWRPGADKPGTFGRFRVERPDDRAKTQKRN